MVQFIAKSKAEIAKSKDTLFKSSFGDLQDGDIYFDPLGWRANRPINGKQAIYDVWKKSGALEEFDRLQNSGFTLAQTIETIQKNYDTGDWSLPTYFVPEVHVVNPQLTPCADLIARQAVKNETVSVTAETGQPTIEFGLEVTNDTENTYTYADGTYTDYTYDVVGYGLASRLEDKMILASNALRSTQSVAQQTHINAIRQAEEKQILRGTDSDGFDGMTDMGSEFGSGIDLTSDVDWKTELRDLINEIEYNGGNPGSIALFTDFETHAEISNDLTDYIRYTDVGSELGFGFRTLEFDNVPVFKTHGISKHSNATSDGDPVVIGADMSVMYMAMLQDVTVKPLAKLGPQEQFATDAYGTLVSLAKDKIQYLASDGTLS